MMATNESAQGRFSAATPAGTLTIKAIRESISVPAGRFDTVHYTRVTGQSVEYDYKPTDKAYEYYQYIVEDTERTIDKGNSQIEKFDGCIETPAYRPFASRT